jgi:hypothetical protein
MKVVITWGFLWIFGFLYRLLEPTKERGGDHGGVAASD